VAQRDPFGPARDALDGTGLNLLGVLSIARYDAEVPAAWRAETILPGARSAVLLGAGGRALFEALERAPEARFAVDPLDHYTRRVAETAAQALEGRALLAFERRGERYADFVALGRAAGLGAPSRLGLLLHPEYGPWLSLRALLLVPRELPESEPLGDFDPCRGCPAPCAEACPGGALAGDRFDVGRCATTRGREPGCALRCDARRACVVGSRHRYSVRAEAHHMRHSALDNSR
jgi:epoxyqueuosine reductase QueG